MNNQSTPINAVVREDGEWVKALNLKTPDELDSNICVGDTIKIYGEQTKVLGFYGAFNEGLMKWETIILTEGRGDPFERSLNKIEVLTPTEGPFTKSKRNGTYPPQPPSPIDKQEQGELLTELQRRQSLIKSEPDGVVRETMIDNLLLDIPAPPAPNPSGVRSKEDEYRANFLWGFDDDSIESLGYEFANGKTEAYLKEVWDSLVSQFKSKPDAVEDAIISELKSACTNKEHATEMDIAYNIAIRIVKKYFKAQPGK